MQAHLTDLRGPLQSCAIFGPPAIRCPKRRFGTPRVRHGGNDLEMQARRFPSGPRAQIAMPDYTGIYGRNRPRYRLSPLARGQGPHMTDQLKLRLY